MKKAQNKVTLKVAANIKAIRERRNLTQAEASKGAGINRAIWGFIEQGRTSPSLNTLIKVSKGLNCPLRDLFKGL